MSVDERPTRRWIIVSAVEDWWMEFEADICDRTIILFRDLCLLSTHGIWYSLTTVSNFKTQILQLPRFRNSPNVNYRSKSSNWIARLTSERRNVFPPRKTVQIVIDDEKHPFHEKGKRSGKQVFRETRISRIRDALISSINDIIDCLLVATRAIQLNWSCLFAAT